MGKEESKGIATITTDKGMMTVTNVRKVASDTGTTRMDTMKEGGTATMITTQEEEEEHVDRKAAAALHPPKVNQNPKVTVRTMETTVVTRREAENVERNTREITDTHREDRMIIQETQEDAVVPQDPSRRQEDTEIANATKITRRKNDTIGSRSVRTQYQVSLN